MQDCTSLQTDNHASTPPLSFFTGRMPFVPPNQQRQSTEGNIKEKNKKSKKMDMLRSVGKQSEKSMESVLKKSSVIFSQCRD